MDILDKIYNALPDLLLLVIVLVVVLGGLAIANWFLLGKARSLGPGKRFPRRIAMIILVLVGIVCVVFALPVDENARQQLFGLLGLLLTVLITLSSTTFLANAMAGLMLRAVGGFRTGDFIQVDEHFGRVTERGFFHTEIQTEDRDLTTFPNLYLVTNPLKVIRYSGTVVSANVSLGYDVPHKRVISLLMEAALEAKLQDPFVQIIELGDFSVSYRIGGFLTEVRQLLAARSNLRAKMLSTLHGAGVEIVSPNFMNQRQLTDQIIPPEEHSVVDLPEQGQVPEQRIFDKANQAEELMTMKQENDSITDEISELQKSLKAAKPEEVPPLEKNIERLQDRQAKIEATIETAQTDQDIDG